MKAKIAIRHVGVIIDGNRRWAKKRGLPTLAGHRQGFEKLKELPQWCIKENIKILTVFAFSTENWNRSEGEVNYLMNILRQAFKKNFTEVSRQGVRIKVIGQKDRLAPDIQKLIEETEAKTKNNKKLLFNLAISYGGRAEILQAVQKIVKQKIKPAKISEELIAKNLWTGDIPDPDLIIRTSGERRLSNFLTWQSVYSELFFIKKTWPDFTQRDLDKVINEYYGRQRRFGK
jgi:undecaprenyl diphosphate synthase